jgi:hypothetical protein
MSSILINHTPPMRDRIAPPHLTSPAVLLFAAATPLVVVAWLAPPMLIAPMICLFGLTMAAVTAVFAWATGARRHASGLTAWDLAGLFTLGGIIAGSVSSAEQAMTLLGLAP